MRNSFSDIPNLTFHNPTHSSDMIPSIFNNISNNWRNFKSLSITRRPSGETPKRQFALSDILKGLLVTLKSLRTTYKVTLVAY